MEGRMLPVLFVWAFIVQLTSTVRLSVSTQKNLLILEGNDGGNGNDEAAVVVKKFEQPAILALTSDRYFSVSIQHGGGAATTENRQIDVTNTSSREWTKTTRYIHNIPNPTDLVHDWKTGDLYISSGSNVFKLARSQQQPSFVLVAASQVQALALDSCSRKLQYISNGQLFQNGLGFQENNKSNVSSNLSKVDAKIIAKQPLNRKQNLFVILAKHDGASHSYSFSVKTSGGRLLCESDPTKDYSIRSIDYDASSESLFMADAHNLVIWRLDLGQQRQAEKQECNLRLWTRLPSQASHLVVLDQKQECILEPPTIVTEEPPHRVIDNQTDTNENNKGKVSCDNYCLNSGECVLSSMNRPVCSCSPGWTGDRCHIDMCFNYCLNLGECTISEELGRPSCSCKTGFIGPRCEEAVQVVLKDDAGVKYFYGFIAMAVFSIVLTLVLLGFVVLYIRHQRRLNKEESGKKSPARNLTIPDEPTIVKKSSRTRVFSTSRSRSRNRHANDSDNKAFTTDNHSEAAKQNALDVCTDANGHICQALITDDGAVLDLEDCCQMTICEKPCIEAIYRKPKSRKGRSVKQTLSPKKLMSKGDSNDDQHNLLDQVDY